MIKNLNDLITFICLIAIILFSLRIMFMTFFAKRNNEVIDNESKLTLIRDYIDNEEE